MQKLLLSFSFLGFFVITNPAFAVSNYIQVNSNIFRGARPTVSDYKTLASDGVKSIVNLENDKSAISKDSKTASQNKMQFFSFPMSWSVTPDTNEVNQVLAVLQDSKDFPVFVHCKHGEDRTGLIIALYRVEVEGWKPEDAYHEMLKEGFHTTLDKLDQYFRTRTGFTGN